MTDETAGGPWSLDPELRSQLRLERVRVAIRDQQWTEAELEAEELLDDEPDHLEALGLLGQAALAAGDAPIARLALEEHARLGGDSVPRLLDLAIARFETCDLVSAAEAAREVVRRDPALAEGHWYLGLSLERLPGGQAQAIAELAAARQLAPDAYPWPLDLDKRAWKGVIDDALAAVHPEVAAFWEGIPIVTVPQPDLDELRRMDPPVSPAVSGLFEGALQPDDDPWDVRPKSMRLFTRNLAICRSVEELVDHVADALEAEALGWLGLGSVDDFDDGDVEDGAGSEE